MKRMMVVIGCLLLSVSLLLLVWQPDAAKKALFDHAARDMTESTAYMLTVDRVSGNIFTGFTLHDLRLLSRSDDVERLRAGTVGVGVSWPALFHKTIQIRHLTCDELTIFNPSVSPARQLVFHNIDLKLRAGAGRIDINSLQMRLDGGRIHLGGWFQSNTAFSGDLDLADQDIPMHKILAFMQPVPAPLHLVHSGQWKMHVSSGAIDVAMAGQLARSPISLHGTWDANTRHYSGNLQWKQTPLYDVWENPSLKSGRVSASLNVSGQGLILDGEGHVSIKETKDRTLADAHMRFSKGVGDYVLHVSSGNNQMVIQGAMDLPHQLISGRGTAENIAWENDRFGKMDASFRVSHHQAHLDLIGHDLQFPAAGNSGNISSLHVSLDGWPPAWQTALTAAFKDGSSIDTDGCLTQGVEGWRYVWQHWGVSFPSTAPWASRNPGSVVWSDREIELRNVNFASGTQSLKLDDTIWRKNYVHFDLAAHEIDLAPWAALLWHGVSVSKGVLNASLRVDGTTSHPHVEGFVDGKIQSLTVAAAALTVENITLNVRHVGENAEIHAAGKTKKGDIQITGHAPWPDLNYDLRIRDMKVATAQKTSAEGDVDLHLGGTLESPTLTGGAHINHGTYTAVPEKKGQKPTVGTLTLWPQGTVDVTLQWPRDVWYRDGVSAIETTGDLRFQKLEGHPAVILSGTIRSIRGAYSYFGRSFTLASGEIQFAGTPELNPALNVEASYASGATTVYLDLTGTADQPILKMHSNPPLSEQDIVSVIVFGQPLSELRTRTGGMNSNQEMMQAAGGVLGSYLSKGLNQTGIPVLNFDVLNIQPADAGGSQLTVGRYLTRKLFISYGQAVQGSAEKTMTADYFLTPKWTLQGASDSVEGNYLDFLFRYPLNKPGAPSNSSPLPDSPFRNTLDPTTVQPTFRTPMQ